MRFGSTRFVVEVEMLCQVGRGPLKIHPISAAKETHNVHFIKLCKKKKNVHFIKILTIQPIHAKRMPDQTEVRHRDGGSRITHFS